VNASTATQADKAGERQPTAASVFPVPAAAETEHLVNAINGAHGGNPIIVWDSAFPRVTRVVYDRIVRFEHQVLSGGALEQIARSIKARHAIMSANSLPRDLSRERSVGMSAFGLLPLLRL
jgi:hypothetical protein